MYNITHRGSGLACSRPRIASAEVVGVATARGAAMWPLASLFRIVTQYVSMASSDRIYRSFLSSLKFFTRGWGPMKAYEG